jgi:5-formyltetrahydrofolate cyclo-ligase
MSEAKRAIRQSVLSARAAIDAAARSAYDASLRRKLFALPAFHHARSVALYVSLPDEPNTAPLIDAALATGKRVALPAVAGETLVFRSIASRDELVDGAYRIPAPDATAPEIPVADLDAVVAPGVAFDRMGNRIGFGGGYFDRALAGYRGPVIALAYPEQIVPKIVPDPWDRAMTAVVVADRL